MAKSLSKLGRSICLWGSHALLVEQLQEQLRSSPYRVNARRLPQLPGEAVPIPNAALYLVDAGGPRAVVNGLLSRILSRAPKRKVLLLVEDFERDRAYSYLRMGVRALLRYSELQSSLLPAVESVGSGHYWVPRNVLSGLVESMLAGATPPLPQSPESLTRREREVLDGLLANLSNKEIAQRLNLSERTVKFHVSNLLGKFGVRRRADLILMSYQDTAGAPGLGTRPKHRS